MQAVTEAMLLTDLELNTVGATVFLNFLGQMCLL